MYCTFGDNTNHDIRTFENDEMMENMKSLISKVVGSGAI